MHGKPRVIIAAPHSGTGKTSVAIGLMAALKARGLAVQPYKVGPDYIDPAFHSFVCGRPSRNLDSWLLTEETVRELFFEEAPEQGRGLSIIEGVMGLFDGLGAGHQGSSAQVAEILQAPVVLVISGEGLSRSAAALVSGFNVFQPGLRLAGVIVNKVSGARHYELLRDVVEGQAGVPCLGYLVKERDFTLESRHLGLVPSAEVAGLAERLAALAGRVAETVDLDRVSALAEAAPPLAAPVGRRPAAGPPVRLGVALDEAFNFYYEDNFKLLKALGAELAPFSPKTSRRLPSNLGGLYIGGGFPEVFAGELAANESLMAELKAALEAGLPCYAECGGLLYLSKTLTDHDGRRHRLVGFFDQETEMTRRLQNFGYVEARFNRNTILGPAGTSVRAHEFHHSRLTDPGDLSGPAEEALTMVKPDGRAWSGGLVKKNTLAAYPHLHFYHNPALAEYFLEQCRRRARN